MEFASAQTDSSTTHLLILVTPAVWPALPAQAAHLVPLATPTQQQALVSAAARSEPIQWQLLALALLALPQDVQFVQQTLAQHAQTLGSTSITTALAQMEHIHPMDNVCLALPVADSATRQAALPATTVSIF